MPTPLRSQALSPAPPLSEPVFRRSISLDTRGEQLVVGWLEDDFHHFGVSVEFAEGRVTDLRAVAVRYPWSTCFDAARAIAAFVGGPLIERPTQLGALLPMASHCTHVFELAALAIAHAAARRPDRLYEARVFRAAPPGPEQTSALRASLELNGAPMLEWRVLADRIDDADMPGGRSLTDGFRAWTEGLPAEAAELAFVLRRAAWLAKGDRAYAALQVAAETGAGPVCYTYQPERRSIARNMAGSIRPFDPASRPLLANRDRTP